MTNIKVTPEIKAWLDREKASEDRIRKSFENTLTNLQKIADDNPGISVSDGIAKLFQP